MIGRFLCRRRGGVGGSEVRTVVLLHVAYRTSMQATYRVLLVCLVQLYYSAQPHDVYYHAQPESTWDVWFGVWCLEVKVQPESTWEVWFRVWSLEVKVQDSGFRV